MQFCTVHSCFSVSWRRLFSHKICTFPLFTFSTLLHINVFLYLQLRILIQADTKQPEESFQEPFQINGLTALALLRRRVVQKKTQLCTVTFSAELSYP